MRLYTNKMDILYLASFLGSVTSIILVGSRKLLGPAGFSGASGKRGPRGPRAEPLSEGPTGPTGPTGPQGLPGNPGPAGSQGLSNTISQVSVKYIDFDQEPSAFSSTNTSLEFSLPRPLKYDVSASIVPSSGQTTEIISGPLNSQISIQFNLPLVNPQGPTGLQGGQGPDGQPSQSALGPYQGSIGPDGPTGLQGATGPSIGTISTANGTRPQNISLLTTNSAGRIIADNSITTQNFISGPVLLNGFTEWASGPYLPGQNVVVEPNQFYSCIKQTSTNTLDTTSWAPLAHAPGVLRSSGLQFNNRARCFAGQDLLTVGSSSTLCKFPMESFSTSGSAMIYFSVIVYNNGTGDPFCQQTFFSSSSGDSFGPMITWSVNNGGSGANRLSMGFSEGVCTVTFSWQITAPWSFDWFAIIN